MNITPELVESAGKAVVGIMAGVGAFVATITSTITAFFTWKNRYELDKLYAHTYRAKSDGTPGPMRRHPRMMVRMFTARARALEPTVEKGEPDQPEEAPIVKQETSK